MNVRNIRILFIKFRCALGGHSYIQHKDIFSTYCFDCGHKPWVKTAAQEYREFRAKIHIKHNYEITMADDDR